MSKRKLLSGNMNDIITRGLATQLRAALPAERIRCNGCNNIGLCEILVLKRQIYIYVKGATVTLKCLVGALQGPVISSEFDLADPESIDAILGEARWYVAFQRYLSDVIDKEMNIHKLDLDALIASFRF